MIFYPTYLLFFVNFSQIDILSFSQTLLFGITFSGSVFIFLETLYFEYVNMEEKYDKINIIANNYCSDNLTNNLFFCILNDFKNLENTTKYCCYWTGIMLITSFCKIILIYTKNYKIRIMLSLNFSISNIITRLETQLLI